MERVESSRVRKKSAARTPATQRTSVFPLGRGRSMMEGPAEAAGAVEAGVADMARAKKKAARAPMPCSRCEQECGRPGTADVFSKQCFSVPPCARLPTAHASSRLPLLQARTHTHDHGHPGRCHRARTTPRATTRHARVARRCRQAAPAACDECPPRAAGECLGEGILFPLLPRAREGIQLSVRGGLAGVGRPQRRGTAAVLFGVGRALRAAFLEFLTRRPPLSHTTTPAIVLPAGRAGDRAQSGGTDPAVQRGELLVSVAWRRRSARTAARPTNRPLSHKHLKTTTGCHHGPPPPVYQL